MKNYIRIVVASFFLVGCSSLNMDRTLVENPTDIGGTYNMIMIGGTFPADAERLVILDVVGDGNTFHPVTFPGRVKTLPEIGADEALKKAEDFFADHCAYNGYQIRKLSRPDGGFVGYELTPDYPPSLCEDGNVLQVQYGRGGEGVTNVYTSLLLKIGTGAVPASMVPEK